MGGSFTISVDSNASDPLNWGSDARDVRDAVLSVAGSRLSALRVTRVGNEASGYNYTLQYLRQAFTLSKPTR